LFCRVHFAERTRLETSHCTQCNNSKTKKTFAAKAKCTLRAPIIWLRSGLRLSPKVWNAPGSAEKNKAPNVKKIAATICRRFIILASRPIRELFSEAFRLPNLRKRLSIATAEKRV
jgi:hypothetical protein